MKDPGLLLDFVEDRAVEGEAGHDSFAVEGESDDRLFEIDRTQVDTAAPVDESDGAVDAHLPLVTASKAVESFGCQENDDDGAFLRSGLEADGGGEHGVVFDDFVVNDQATLTMRLSAGQQGNLRPDAVLKALGLDEEGWRQIERAKLIFNI